MSFIYKHKFMLGYYRVPGKPVFLCLLGLLCFPVIFGLFFFMILKKCLLNICLEYTSFPLFPLFLFLQFLFMCFKHFYKKTNDVINWMWICLYRHVPRDTSWSWRHNSPSEMMDRVLGEMFCVLLLDSYHIISEMRSVSPM